MSIALIAQLGLPFLVEVAKYGLEKLDNPIAKKASEALQDVELAVKQGQISDEDLRLAKEHIEKMRDIERAESETALREINQSLRLEVASMDPYVRRMRPTFGYVMALTWMVQMLSVAYVIVDEPENSSHVVAAMESLTTIWTVGLSVLGIYMYRRSREKYSGESDNSLLQTLSQFKKQLKK